MIFEAAPWIVRGYLYPYSYIEGTPTRKPFSRDYRDHTLIREELVFLGGKINSLLRPGFDVGIASRVETAFLEMGEYKGFRCLMSTNEAHVPMIDFTCPVTPENLAKIKKRLSLFNEFDLEAVELPG